MATGAATAVATGAAVVAADATPTDDTLENEPEADAAAANDDDGAGDTNAGTGSRSTGGNDSLTAATASLLGATASVAVLLAVLYVDSTWKSREPSR